MSGSSMQPPQFPKETIPAFSALAASLVLALLFFVWDASSVADRYRRMALAALQTGDAETARVAALRLLGQGESGRNEALFLLARAHLAAGNTGAARSVWNLIAPDHEAVYAPAHLFLATTLARNPDAASQRMAVHHAGLAQSLDPSAAEPRLITGRIAVRQRNWALARRSLEEAALTDPTAVFELLPVLRLLGEEEAAAAWVQRANDAFARQVAQSPSVEALRNLARAQVEAGDFSAARATLQPERLRAELEQLYERWISQKLPPDERQKIASEGAQIFPQNPALRAVAEGESNR